MNIPQDTLNSTLGALMDVHSIKQGLENLALLPSLDLQAELPAPYPGKPYTVASIGFKRFGGDENQVAIATNGAIPRYLSLPKYVSLVEQMHNPKHSTVVLQNYQAPSNRQEGRGQVVGRLVPSYSAIIIALGTIGGPIRDESDILRLDSFMLDRSALSAFYLAAKLQLGGETRLNEVIAKYEGLRFYEIPSDMNEVVDMSALAGILG